jgi:hypothetical protein
MPALRSIIRDYRFEKPSEGSTRQNDSLVLPSVDQRRESMSGDSPMAFRFFRRIKIAPGLSLNVSKSGFSASIGPRGAKLTVGRRGISRSLGIPGTGLSWRDQIAPARQRSAARASRDLKLSDLPTSEVAQALNLAPEAVEVFEALKSGTDGVTKTFKSGAELLAHWGGVRTLPGAYMIHPQTGRRMNDAQVRTFAAKMDRDNAVEKLNKEIAQEEESLQSVVRYWHPLPPIPHWDTYSKQYEELHRVPFPEPQPDEPAPPLTESAVRSALEAEQDTLLAGNILNQVLPWIRKKKVSEAVEKLLPERLQQAKETHADTVAAYQQKMEQHRQKELQWREDCLAQAQELYALMEGKDVELVLATASAAVEELDLPFEADCQVMLDDDTRIFVDIDLPEIEDVLAETQRRVNKDGTERLVKRKAEDRNEMYAELVLGHCLNVAAQLFISLPRLMELTLAAYTQRKARKASDADTYVLELKASREAMQNIAKMQLENIACLHEAMSLVGARYQTLATRAMKGISRPDWTVDGEDLGSLKSSTDSSGQEGPE